MPRPSDSRSSRIHVGADAVAIASATAFALNLLDRFTRGDSAVASLPENMRLALLGTAPRLFIQWQEYASWGVGCAVSLVLLVACVWRPTRHAVAIGMRAAVAGCIVYVCLVAAELSYALSPTLA